MITGRIYALICPITNNPFYVGSTTLSLKERLQGHKSASKKSMSKVAVYIRDNNITPIIKLIKTVTVKSRFELRSAEYAIISNFSKKHKLTNIILSHDLIISDFETVKLRKDIVNKVRKNKLETGIPVATFFEMAAEEKLKKQ